MRAARYRTAPKQSRSRSGEPSARGCAPATGASSAPASSASSLRSAAEAKLLCQNALWREARRVAGDDGQLSQGALAALIGAGVAAAIEERPALFAKLGAELAGCELPPPLRRAAWRHALLTPAEVKRCSDVLRASDEYGDARAAAAAAVAEGRLAAALPTLPAQMIARGLARAPPAERPRLERLATALIHRAYLCNGAQLPAPLGAHAAWNGLILAVRALR